MSPGPGRRHGRIRSAGDGSVLVNPGGLAFYRPEILREHEAGYLGETFAGRPVPFSDDSLLTLYSLARGRAVAPAPASR